jgi:hypothetical protein
LRPIFGIADRAIEGGSRPIQVASLVEMALTAPVI